MIKIIKTTGLILFQLSRITKQPVQEVQGEQEELARISLDNSNSNNNSNSHSSQSREEPMSSFKR